MSKTQEMVEKILALRELTRSTGTRTTRTVNDLLQSLTAEELTEVAVGLKRAEMRNTLSGISKGNDHETQPR